MLYSPSALSSGSTDTVKRRPHPLGSNQDVAVAGSVAGDSVGNVAGMAGSTAGSVSKTGGGALASSSESLTTLSARLRKISGTASDPDSSYSHNIRHVRGGGSGAGVDDRIIFVTTEKKVPFAVFSVLPVRRPGAGVGAAGVGGQQQHHSRHHHHHHQQQRSDLRRTRTNSGNRQRLISGGAATDAQDTSTVGGDTLEALERSVAGIDENQVGRESACNLF